MGLYDVNGKNLSVSDSTYYVCTEYGITTDNEDNTAVMQSLIDTVYKNGGGTIFIPNGTYKFLSSSAKIVHSAITRLLKPLSGVCIVGENIADTILQVSGNSASGCSLFAQSLLISGEEELVGCEFSNFTVDMSACTVDSYSWRGKGFMGTGLIDCVFRDLRFVGTPATSLGIDCLKNVTIDSVYVYKGGRLWTSGGSGGAGIGIGTGEWTDNYFVIRNCICDDCGNFGIFLENQENHTTPDFQGQIITNNVVCHGRGRGIGARTSKNALIVGNNIYDCVTGLYVDDASKNVSFLSNHVEGCETGFEYGNGVSIGNGSGYACSEIVVSGNVFANNGAAIKKTVQPTNSTEQYNTFINNTVNEQ